MKLSEFKAWFEGFTEGLDGPPNERQWKRIKEQVTAIDGGAVTEQHYVWQQYVWPKYPHWRRGLGPTTSVLGQSDFDAHVAMYALGKNDRAVYG